SPPLVTTRRGARAEGSLPGSRRAYVVTRLGPHVEIAPVLQQLVGPEDGGEAHAFLPTVCAHRREPVAGPERAGLDQAHQLVAEALIEDAIPAARAGPADNCTGQSGHMLKLLWLQQPA